MTELKPEDLRIGNWVCENDIFENPAWHHTVIGIGIKESDDIWLSNCDIFKASELYPIPLSEDWLKRLDVDYFAINESYRGRYLQLTITGITYFFFTDTNTLERDAMPIKIEFVHQIQNLIHSLTGAELKARGI